MNNHMLSLWNDGHAKRQIIEFVENVTSEGSREFRAAARSDRHF